MGHRLRRDHGRRGHRSLPVVPTLRGCRRDSRDPAQQRLPARPHAAGPRARHQRRTGSPRRRGDRRGGHSRAGSADGARCLVAVHRGRSAAGLSDEGHRAGHRSADVAGDRRGHGCGGRPPRRHIGPEPRQGDRGASAGRGSSRLHQPARTGEGRGGLRSAVLPPVSGRTSSVSRSRARPRTSSASPWVWPRGWGWARTPSPAC